MIIGALLIGLLIAYGMSENLNSGLPARKRSQDFGLLEFVYMGLRVVAPFFLLFPLETLQFHWKAICIGAGLYLVAYLIKLITRYLAYDLTKCPF